MEANETQEPQHANAAPETKQPSKTQAERVEDYRKSSVVTNTVHWSPGVSLESMERQVILAAFRFYRGNKTATAQSLGIAIRTLDNKLEKYQADDKEQETRADATLNERNEFLKASRGIAGAKPPAKPTPAADEFIKQREARRAREAEGAQRAGQDGESSEGGVRMESSSKARPEQSVSMPIGSEVQKVLPKQTSGHRQSRGR